MDSHPGTQPQPVLPHRLVRKIVWTSIVVIVAVSVLVGFYYGYYVPTNDHVRTGGGAWIVNGGSGSLAVSLACSNCGQSVTPGGQFTVHLNVGVESQTCGFFGCNGYTVESFSVDAPYSIVQTSPNNLPYYEQEGSFNTWAVTVQAPTTPGHAPLSGEVAVAYS